MKQKKGLLKRSIALVIGLFIMSIGVGLSVKANLGTTPISCTPYVYSLGFPSMTMGTLTTIMNVALILFQIILLRKNYQLMQLFQLPVALLFGVFTDVALNWISADVLVVGYPLQWVYCILGCALVAIGVFLQVKAKLIYLAGDGLAMAISKTFHIEFGKAKVCFDSSLVTIGIISSFIMLHNLQGIREGTVVAAVLVGTFVRLFNRKLAFVDVFLNGKKTESATIETNIVEEPNNNLVITIAREFGSGGHQIGEIIAKELGISFYDKELIDLSAQKSGLTPEYVKEHEQKLTNSLLYELYGQNYASIDEEIPPLDALFLAQSKVIADLCKEGPCVIVGRCADFVLKNRPNCFTVFIHANKDFRVLHATNEYGIAPNMAEQELDQKDRERTNHYKYYTNKVWGAADNYNLTIDSSLLGLEGSAQIIIEAAQKIRKG
ncbi:MAG: cytidylate kinase family protein [Bacteroidaceae bacterium]